jgi:hypothetical protein
MVGGDGADDPPLDPAEEEEVDEPLRDKDGERSMRPRVASLGHLEEIDEVTAVTPRVYRYSRIPLPLPSPPLTSSHLPSPPLISSHLPAPPLISSHIPSPPLTSSHLPSPPLTSSHLPSPPLTSSHLLFPTLTFSITRRLLSPPISAHLLNHTPPVISSYFRSPSQSHAACYLLLSPLTVSFTHYPSSHLYLGG